MGWRARTLMLLLASLLVGSTARGLETDCRNGLDDDGDSWTDCQDADCGCATVMRDFPVVRYGSDPSRPWRNLYLLSYPEDAFPGDRGDSAAPGDKCLNRDGVIDSTDALCYRNIYDYETIVLWRWDARTCAYSFQSRQKTPFGITFDGMPFDLSPHEGLVLTVASDNIIPPVNRCTLDGWNDPSWPGTPVQRVSTCYPGQQLLHIPFDSMYRRADEILCGLEGLDWMRGPDGDPTTCPNGIFDGTTPISVETHDNDPSDAPTGLPITNDMPVVRSVLMTAGGLQFLGTDFDIEVGDAVIVQVRDDHRPTLFLPPRS